MSNILKRTIGIVMTAVMIFAFLPIVNGQAYAAGYPDEISVGYRDSDGTSHSVKLNAEKPYYINGNPEAQASVSGGNYNAWYDASSHELVLNNYDGISIDERSGSGDLTIFVSGNNRIDSRGNNAINLPKGLQIQFMNNAVLEINNNYVNGSSFGVRTGENIVITGTGSLNITSETSSTNTTDDAFGIYSSSGDITITNYVKVDIKCITGSGVTYGKAWGIYAHTGNIEISTYEPMTIDLISEGTDGGVTGIQTAGGSTAVTISNIPSITMDLKAKKQNYIYGLLPTRAVNALDAADYRVVKEETEGYVKYRIEPKPFVPEVIDIKFDQTNLNRLTVDKTGSDVAALFFNSIISPNGETCPAGTPEGWYIKLGDVTGFCDDTGDPRNMEESTEALEWGAPYFLCFEVAAEPGYKWNANQEFTINGSEDVIESSYDSDGKKVYQISLMMLCEDNINKAEMSDVSDIIYNGSAYLPTPALVYDGEKLTKDDHYTISYTDGEGNPVTAPTDSGRYQLIVTGGYCFYGTLSADFNIEPAEITEDSISGISDKVYNGKAVTQSVSVNVNGMTLTKDKDYTVTYKNNTSVGTASVTIEGKGNYTGKVTKTFEIKVKEITPTVTLSKASFTYNGKAQKPTVTVKDGSTVLAASQYTVAYSPTACKNVGKVNVKVTLKGNYKGTKTVSYKINPKGRSIKSVTPASKAITVNWVKQAEKMSTSYISGYQIYVATDSKFTKNVKKVYAEKYSTVSKKITGLKGNTKYYVKMRTYKTVAGVKYYSPWCTVKTVTTKA